MVEEEVEQLPSSLSKLATRGLTFTLDRELVRAVRLKLLMMRFGHHLRSGNIDGAEQVDQLIHLAHQTVHYDYFLSHEWGTGRFKKFLTLCVYYNLVPAIVVSFAVSVVAMVLEIVGALPLWGTHRYVIANLEFKGNFGRWPMLLAPVAYVVTLFCWQHIRPWLGLRMVDVFFDRFCVDQVDDTKKTAAILGLGGFVERSDKFLILWSPRYFTRLWCVYEVATWMYLQKPDANMIFVPVQIAVCVLGAQCFCFLALVLCVTLKLSDVWGLTIILVMIVFMCFSSIKVVQYVMEDLLRIQQQLASFSMCNADCYCCSVNHKDCISGREIKCDRRLVCTTIEAWFSAAVGSTIESDQEPEGVANFESYVRANLAANIMQRISGRLPIMILIALITYPWSWYSCTFISFELALESHPYRCRELLYHVVLLFVQIPLSLRFVFLSASWMLQESSSWPRGQRYVRRLGIFGMTLLVWSLSLVLPIFISGLQSGVPHSILVVLSVVSLLLLSRMQVLTISESDQSDQVPVGPTLDEALTEHRVEAANPVIVGQPPNPNTIGRCGSDQDSTWSL